MKPSGVRSLILLSMALLLQAYFWLNNQAFDNLQLILAINKFSINALIFTFLLLVVDELFLNVSIIPTDSLNSPSSLLSVPQVYLGCRSEIRLP